MVPQVPFRDFLGPDCAGQDEMHDDVEYGLEAEDPCFALLTVRVTFEIRPEIREIDCLTYKWPCGHCVLIPGQQKI